MAFIFVQSAMPDYASAEESDFFVTIAKAIIGTVSTWSVDPEILSMVIRKTAHFTEYMVFGVSLLLTVGELAGKIRKRRDSSADFGAVDGNEKAILPAWLIGTLYAVSDEIHQSFVPGRFCSWKDMCIDSAGVITGCMLCLAVLHLIAKRIEKKNG